MRPDADRSRLGRDDRVTDGATHVSTEDAAREIEVQHTGRTEEAVVVVDLVVEPHPGLDGEGTFKDDAGLGDGGSRAVQGEHTAEDATQLSGDDCEFGAIAQGDGQLLGNGRLDVGDGDGFVG